jgi:hypothetical protein
MGIIHSIVDMTDEKYDTTGVMWLESESESVRSRKFPARVHDVLRRLAGADTMSKSRAAGAAILFYNPHGYHRRREMEVEKELKTEGLDLTPLPLFSIISEKNYFEDVSAKLVDKSQWADVDNPTDTTVSVPKVVKDSLEAEADRHQNYNLNSKVRLMCNMILGYDASVFKSQIERLETKEQLLKVLRDEPVKNPTPALDLIRDGKVHGDVHQQVFARKEQMDTLEGIEPEDDITVEEDHPIFAESWGPDGLDLKKTDGRAGVMMAYLRSDDRASYNIPTVEYIFEQQNPDYNDSGRVVGEYIKPHLTQGSDGMWYVDADNAPTDFDDSEADGGVSEGEYVEAVIDDISALSGTSQKRTAKSAIKNKTSIDHRTLEGSTSRARMARRAYKAGAPVSEIEAMRDYFAAGKSQSKSQLMGRLKSTHMEFEVGGDA